MKQEFVTSRGKVIIERDILYIKNLNSSIEDTVAGRLLMPLIILAMCIINLTYPNKKFDIFIGILFGIFFLGYTPRLYDIFIKRSYANRIPLNRINTFEQHPDELGLETFVKLHLKNGRYRIIPFRTLEKQYEPFTELVSQYIAYPQLSV